MSESREAKKERKVKEKRLTRMRVRYGWKRKGGRGNYEAVQRSEKVWKGFSSECERTEEKKNESEEAFTKAEKGDRVKGLAGKCEDEGKNNKE